MRYYPVFVLLLLPFAAVADQQRDEEFRAMDHNGDGYISAAEAAGFRDVVRRFDKADRNRDGKLSRAEYARLKAMKPSRSESAAAGGTAPRGSRRVP